MKRSLCAVKGHFRHYPVKKRHPKFIPKTVELFVDLKTRDLEFDLEQANLEMIAADASLPNHLGMVD